MRGKQSQAAWRRARAATTKNSETIRTRTATSIVHTVRTSSKALVDLQFGFPVCLLLTPDVGGRRRAPCSCTHGTVEPSATRTSSIHTYSVSSCSPVDSDAEFELPVQQNPLPDGASSFRGAGTLVRVFLGHLCTDRPENAGFGIAGARAAAARRAAALRWSRAPLGSALHTQWHGLSSSAGSAPAAATWPHPLHSSDSSALSLHPLHAGVVLCWPTWSWLCCPCDGLCSAQAGAGQRRAVRPRRWWQRAPSSDFGTTLQQQQASGAGAARAGLWRVVGISQLARSGVNLSTPRSTGAISTKSVSHLRRPTSQGHSCPPRDSAFVLFRASDQPRHSVV